MHLKGLAATGVLASVDSIRRLTARRPMRNQRPLRVELPVTDAVLTTPTRLLVDGVLRPAAGGREYPDVDPTTGEVVGFGPDASVEDADEAVRAARRAFDRSAWSSDPALRADRLRRFAAALEGDREVLRALLVREAGVPVRLTRSVLLDAGFAELAAIRALLDGFPWRERLTDVSFHGFTSAREAVSEPAGVAAVVTPANFPVTLLLRDLFLALAAGNAVVVKPSPHVPLAALEVARVAAEAADLPAGVLNVVTGWDGAGLGLFLAGHELVDLVAVTGSTATGRAVARAAAPKRLVTRLGGNGAHVVLDDADWDIVAAVGARVCFHAGQACTLFKRLLVPRDRLDDAVDVLREAMASVPVGDPRDPDVIMGPVVSADLRDRVLAFAAEVEASGGTVHRVGDVPFTSGFFVRPMLVTGLPRTCDLVRHELPGPVLAVLPYDSEDEAVEIANDPPYGLSAAVSGSPARAAAIAGRLRAGAVTVNDGLPYGSDAPFQGMRGSGSAHAGGEAALRDYLVTKVVGFPG